MAAGRELTKLHEEFFRGSISESLAWLAQKPPRGEFSLVIAQAEEEIAEDSKEEVDPLLKVRALIAGGMPKKEALQLVAKENKVPKRELYNRLILAEEGETE